MEVPLVLFVTVTPDIPLPLEESVTVPLMFPVLGPPVSSELSLPPPPPQDEPPHEKKVNDKAIKNSFFSINIYF